jgi:hypothetical protein
MKRDKDKKSREGIRPERFHGHFDEEFSYQPPKDEKDEKKQAPKK